MHDEDAIWELARLGDQKMFAKLVRRYERPLYGFLARHVGDRTQAEDLFQDTFLRAYERRWSYSAKGRFRAWLYAIALNLVRGWARRTKRQRQLRSIPLPVQDETGQITGYPADSLQDDSAPEPAQAAARSEQGARVQAALAQLPREQREVVILRIYQQLSFEEIARITGEVVGTLKSRMFYALKKLRPKLTRIARAGGYLK